MRVPAVRNPAGLTDEEMRWTRAHGMDPYEYAAAKEVLRRDCPEC